MRIQGIEALIVGSIGVLGITAQHLDPIKNYCTRFDHQSAVKNGMLYICMGSETFVDLQNSGTTSDTVTVGYNEYMIKVNLSTSWDWKVNISEIASNITVYPSTGTLPPQVVRGTLYQGNEDDDRIYLYGGTTSFANTSFPGWQPPLPSAYSLWSYDVVSRQWSQIEVGNNAPYRPSSGAAAEALDQGLVFYFNGEFDSGSWQEIGIVSGTNVFVSGMVVINTTDHTMRNLSTAQVSVDSARARGRMQYVPGVGLKGILVLIGGSSFPANQLDGTDVINPLPMTEVDVFDVATVYNTSTPDGVWYRQNTTTQNATDVPSPRVDFCLVLASAQDLSSHNIYMYGGRDGADPPNYFDDIWVLSLPSFTWTQIWSGTSPRFAHTCHLVGNRTMLTVGGVSNANQMQGQYYGQFPQCDWETAGLGVYDMSDLIWGSVYDASAPVYEVPDPVISVIGGSRAGGATLKMPSSNFSQDGLARLFGFDLDDQPECPRKTAHKRTATIAGTVCGVVVLVILVALGGYKIWRWRKMQAARSEEQVFEKDVYSDVHGGVVDRTGLASHSLGEPAGHTESS